MKKHWIPAVFVFAIAFFLVSCDTENMDNETSKLSPFIGMWEWQDEYDIERFEFTENEVTFYFEQKSIPHSMTNPSTDKGTYEYTDSHIVFEWERMSTTSADYIIRGSELTMTHNATGKVIKYQKIN